jgi:hypothetical protein
LIVSSYDIHWIDSVKKFILKKPISKMKMVEVGVVATISATFSTVTHPPKKPQGPSPLSLVAFKEK